MTRHLTSVLVAAAFSAAFGLGCMPPPALSHYVRSEDWTEERATWLHENCQLVGPVTSTHLGVSMGEVPRENYWQILEYDGVDIVPGWKSLAYACPVTPPWPRVDGARVKELYGIAHDGEDLTKCAYEGRAANDPPSRGWETPPAKVEVEVVSPGTGPGPSADSFVRVRLRRLGAPQRTKKEAGGKPPPHAPIPFEYVSTERVVHLTCLPSLSTALLELRVGGRAHVAETVTEILGSYVGRWEVELLEVGGEELLRRDLGFDR